MSCTSSSQPEPDCILLTANSYVGQLRNATTASCTTRNHDKLEVSLCPVWLPLPSNLYVHCPDLTLVVPPRVIRAVEDLFLFRVAVDCRPDGVTSPDESDYFVYRAGNEREPSLQRLLRPHPFFQDDDVGLLSYDANYTVVALIAVDTVYELHTFHSETPTEWVFRKVSVTEPQQRFPVLIPQKCTRLLYHESSTVVPIGGEAGTMGFVNLYPSPRCAPRRAQTPWCAYAAAI
jgi:hypothetical protein